MSSTKVQACLSIFGEGFLPSDVDELLGIKSTSSHKLGELVANSRDIRYKEASWDYETGFKETLFVEDVLEDLLDIFSKKIDLIRQYARQKSLICKIFVVIEISEKMTPGLFLDKKIIKFANEIEAEIDIDLYLVE
jgi:hypothetical protein